MNRAERKEKLEAEAERIARALVDRGATLVVVFGSLARDDVWSTSDLDMIAVMDSDLPFIKRLERLYVDLEPRVGLDLLVYTPAEMEEMKGRSFIRQAFREGRILHAS